MVITGTATIFGTKGTVTVGSVAMTVVTGIGLKANHPKADLKDGDDSIKARAYGARNDTLSVDFTPIADSGTNTQANVVAKFTLPAVGATVAIANTGVPDIDGNWNYDGEGSINLRGGQAASMTLPLVRIGAVGANTYPSAVSITS